MAHPQHPYNWEPIRHTVFQDPKMADLLHRDGITIQPFLSESQLTELRGLYQETHSLSDENGGMFYSVYSQDLAYREQIHQRVQAILQPTLDNWFQGYKNVVNSFVIKLPGKASEFAIHQDTTALDETRFSPLSVWIPLWDVTPENGAMCMVPGTHRLFSPYRGISFPFPFAKANDAVREYLEPTPVKAGEAILFDPRVLHNSLPNQTESPRVALICGIFPQEARFNICFKEGPEAEIEIYEQEDDFLLKYPNFLHHCHDRPAAGHVIKKVADHYPMLNSEQFRELLGSAGIQAKNLALPTSAETCNMIAEPDNADREPLVPYEEVQADPEPVMAEAPRRGGFLSRLFGKGK